MIRHTTGAGAHTRVRRLLSFLGNTALWVVIAFNAYFLWPATLGGATTFIIVSGHSMEPEYHTGDLVVARAGVPSIGDNIVYTPEGYGNAKVVHQVIGGDAETGWVVKGINNSWTDPWTPKGDEVVGIVTVLLPNFGRFAGFLISPILWGGILFIALALLLWPSPHDDDGDEGQEPSGEVSRVSPSVAGARL